MEADIRVRASSGSASRHGEASSEKTQEAILGGNVVSDLEASFDAMASVSLTDQVVAVSPSLMGMLWRGFLL